MSEEYKRGYMDACKAICHMIADKQGKIRELNKQRFGKMYFSGDNLIHFLKLMMQAIADNYRAKMKENGDVNG